MKTAPQQTIDMRLKLIAAFMLFLSALFLGLLADLLHAPLLIAVMVLPSLFMAKPLQVNDRSVTYSILAAMTASIILGYFFPVERGRLGFFSYFFKPEYYGVGALSLAAISLYFPSANLIAATVISATVFVLGSCGDVSNLNYVNQRFIWGSDWINVNYHRAYAGMIAVQLALGLYLLRLSLPPYKDRKDWRSPAFLNMFSVLLLSITIASFLFLHKKYEKQLHNLEHSFIAIGGHNFFKQFIRHSEPFFSDQVDLNLPFPFGDPKNERRILLRVISSQAPGYLRSRVFTHYEDGRWQSTKSAALLPLQSELAEGLLAMSSYTREGSETEDMSIFDVFFSTALHIDRLPLPVPFAKIELVADMLQVDLEGQAQVEKWKREAGYRVSCPDYRRADMSFDLPENGQWDDAIYLQMPENMPEALAQWWLQQEEYLQSASISDLCHKLTAYLQHNYIYSLGPFIEEPKLPGPGTGTTLSQRKRHIIQKKRRQSLTYRRRLLLPEGDPVLYFLQESKAGHCELFASALTLLLRQQGIPARYVTGFICNEKHPSDSYYVSRLGHAHAWVEAYDRQQGKWLLLDPTPADGRNDYTDDWNWLEAKWDQAGNMLTRILAAAQRGLIGETVASSLKLLLRLLYSPPGIVAISLLLLLLLQRQHRKSVMATALLSPQQKKIAAEYKKLRRKWEKILGLPKNPAGTARELLQAAAKHPNLSIQEYKLLKEKIQLYEVKRFR